MEKLRHCIGALYGGNVRFFAEKVGVNPQSIYKYLSGERRPRPNVARKIVIACERKLTLEDLYSSCALNKQGNNLSSEK